MYADHFNWLNAHVGCHSQCAYLIYIYIYIYKELKFWISLIPSILVSLHISVNLVKLQKHNHKALLVKEIFDYIKWWIIILGVSPCKPVFYNHQRCVYIPLSSRSLETKVFT